MAPTPAASTPAFDGEVLVRAVVEELSRSLNYDRTVGRLLDLIRPGLADWAMLLLLDGRREGFEVAGGHNCDFRARVRRDDLEAGVIDQVLRSWQPELLHVSADDAAGSLAEIIAEPRLLAEAAALRPADVLVVPLAARGVLTGLMVLLRGAGRGFEERDVALAATVAERAAVALDSALMYEERARVGAVLEESLRTPELPDLERLSVAVGMRLASEHLELGGDFVDLQGDEDDLLVVLGDVCGKGVEAAVLNGKARQTIRTAALFDKRPGVVLAALNNALYEPESVKFVTAAAARFSARADGGYSVDVAVAGHEGPLVVRADGSVEQVQVRGPLAGVFPSTEPLEEVRAELGAGDLLLVFSDGITESRDRGGAFFGLEGLRRVARQYAGLDARTVTEAVERAVVEVLDGRGHDDLSLLAVGVRP
ncbi:MAG TPA: GAF domain-containing SpoIIE family protein phosphatase [Nocardioidaceae bacterium]|nr:GAF domain-containing SpoIIE family protein phosphatase [Nocardioidaceae bacterium]